MKTGKMTILSDDVYNMLVHRNLRGQPMSLESYIGSHMKKFAQSANQPSNYQDFLAWISYYFAGAETNHKPDHSYTSDGFNSHDKADTTDAYENTATDVDANPKTRYSYVVRKNADIGLAVYAFKSRTLYYDDAGNEQQDEKDTYLVIIPPFVARLWQRYFAQDVLQQEIKRSIFYTRPDTTAKQFVTNIEAIFGSRMMQGVADAVKKLSEVDFFRNVIAADNESDASYNMMLITNDSKAHKDLYIPENVLYQTQLNIIDAIRDGGVRLAQIEPAEEIKANNEKKLSNAKSGWKNNFIAIVATPITKTDVPLRIKRTYPAVSISRKTDNKSLCEGTKTCLLDGFITSHVVTPAAKTTAFTSLNCNDYTPEMMREIATGLKLPMKEGELHREVCQRVSNALKESKHRK